MGQENHALKPSIIPTSVDIEFGGDEKVPGRNIGGKHATIMNVDKSTSRGSEPSELAELTGRLVFG